MDYMKSHRECQGWASVITVLLGTGIRIGECLGVRWDDLDFEKRIISVNHTLIYGPDENGFTIKRISTPKTVSSQRTIPMINEVFDVFLQEYELQKCTGFTSEEIDGYSNSAFATALGMVYSAASVNHAINRFDLHITEKKVRKQKERKENRFLLHILQRII